MLGCLDPDPVLRDRARTCSRGAPRHEPRPWSAFKRAGRAKAERIASSLAATSCELASVAVDRRPARHRRQRFGRARILSCYVSVFEDGPSPGGSVASSSRHDRRPRVPNRRRPTFPRTQLALEPWLSPTAAVRTLCMAVHFDGDRSASWRCSARGAAYVYDALGDMMGMAIERIRRSGRSTRRFHALRAMR